MASNHHRNLLLPVDNPTLPVWQTNPHPLHDHRSTEELPETCDVLIIGAGFAGVATVYNLVNGEDIGGTSELSVVILEARGACSGATGRNGGHVRPDHFGTIPTYAKRFGLKAAEEFAEYEIANFHAIKKLVRQQKIDCDLVVTRTCTAFTNQRTLDKYKPNYEMLAGLPYMDDFQFVIGEAAESISGVKGALACSSYTAASVFPYKFIMHLLDSALNTGHVNLQTHTPVIGISKAPDGTLVVKTERGFIHTKKVIHANNGYVAGLLPEYKHSIIPCKGICSHITVPEEKVAPLLTNSYIIATTDNGMDYLIPRPDGSIIVGGASHMFRADKHQWYNNTDDSILIEAVKDYYDGYMQRTFQGWEDSGAKVKELWTGVMGYSYDSLPHVGDVPERLNQMILAGFNGHGMPVIWLAAKGVAEMIRKGTAFEDVGLPKIMKTTMDRILAAKNGPEGGDIL
ncbi:FAD dependent oxidoreductase-like protein superfamily [Calycina marina]|uniref:FAD dependent oxidoreductase-like protein superfamily n=1 Tax=Calycina marina TaxID=1763456 RepID=A0A9P8CDP0_9HELO|nr:FAD dependent oxidoreductase-like protein superfamily [Calycina marina]